VSDAWPQIGALAWRSVVRTRRQPAAVIFPLIFPMMLLLVNSGGAAIGPFCGVRRSCSHWRSPCSASGGFFSTMNAGTDLARTSRRAS
jgi:hypothetical protein